MTQVIGDAPFGRSAHSAQLSQSYKKGDPPYAFAQSAPGHTLSFSVKNDTTNQTFAYFVTFAFRVASTRLKTCNPTHVDILKIVLVRMLKCQPKNQTSC